MAVRTWTGTASGDVGVAGNYLEGQVPVDGDDLYAKNGAVSMDTNLAALAAVLLDSLHVYKAFTGDIGTETAYLQIGAKEVHIGEHYGTGSPAGSSRLKLDLQNSGSEAPVVTVHDSATTATDSGKMPIEIFSDHASTEIHVRRGRVGIADGPGETATVSVLEMTYVDSQGSDAEVVVGEGVTLGTLTKDGGECTLRCAATTVVNRAGDMTTEGEGAINSLTCEDGEVTANSAGAITTANMDGGLLDALQSRVPRAIGTVNLRGDGAIKYDPAVLTIGALNANGPVELRAA